MPSTVTTMTETRPSPFNYILSFLMVGIAWGFTTPFIRRAAVKYKSPTPETHPALFDPSRSWLSRKSWTVFYLIIGLLRTPSYAIPLLCNLTGSVWFFLLVGQAGMYCILVSNGSNVANA
jgi:Putative transmembrane family 234